MNKKQILLVCLVSSILGACGSSSSSSSSHTGPNSGHSPAPTAPTAQVDGVVMDRNGDYVAYSDGGSADLNTITLEGVNVALIPTGIIAGSLVTINNRTVSGTNYADSKFGLSSDANTWGFFSHGNLTQTMPPNGTASYAGDAVGIIEGNPATHRGESFINVDFGAAKSVSGTLSNWNVIGSGPAMPDVTFTADITGNKFSRSNSPLDTVQGRFYGNNAAEIGGVILKEIGGKIAISSFGAIKQ